MSIQRRAAGACILLAAAAAAVLGVRSGEGEHETSGPGASHAAATAADGPTAGSRFRALTVGAIAPAYTLTQAQTVPGFAWRVAAGDFDGDGRQDLATLAEAPGSSDGEVRVFLQDANGQLGAPTASALPTEIFFTWYQSIDAADLNGDGRSDLVVTQRKQAGMYYGLSQPGGGFYWREDKWTSRIPSGPVHFADMDNDGNLDVVAHAGSEYGTGQIVVYHGDGAGNLFRHTSTPIGEGRASMAVGQLSGTAVPDVLMVGTSPQGPHFPGTLRNEGAGTLAPPSSLLARWQDEYATAHIADFTGDGVADPAMTTYLPGGRVLVAYPRAADGTLAAKPVLHAIGTSYNPNPNMAVADLDGSGLPDVLQFQTSGTGGDPRLMVSLQDAYNIQLPVYTPVTIPNPNAEYYANALATADLDGDGVREVLVASSQGVNVFRGALVPYAGGASLPGAPAVTAAVDATPLEYSSNAHAAVTVVASANDGGSAITGYTVFTVGGGGYDLDAGTGPGVHRVAGLEQGRSYLFVARARNAAGMGPPSTPYGPLAFPPLINPDALPKLNFYADGYGVEGDIGRSPFKIWFTLDKPAPAGGASFDLVSVSGTATDGVDYEAITKRRITIPESQQAIAIDFAYLGDTLAEGNEVFYLDTSNPQGVDLTGVTHKAMDLFDDGDGGGPRLSVSTVDVVEGNAGTKVGNVTVLLSSPAPSDVVFDVRTKFYGQAVPHEDYVPFEHLAYHIPAGQTQAVFPVTIIGDAIFEESDTVLVELTNPQGANWSPWPLEGGVRIVNDDPTPTLWIEDLAVPEGNGGIGTVGFKVKLSTPAPYAVEFAAVTVQGTAKEGFDYLPQYLWYVAIPPGETEVLIPIDVVADDTYERNESFSLRLEDVYGAPVTDNIGVATLQNDDPPPEVRVTDASVPEGQTAQVYFQLNRASSLPVVLSVRTALGTAFPGVDYTTAQNGNLVIPAGNLFGTLSVSTTQDTAVEDNETLVVEIASAVDATTPKPQGLLRIVNDDLAILTVSDVTVTEGNSGLTPATIEVQLSAPMPTATTFDIAVTAEGTSQPNDRVAPVLTGVRIDAGRTRFSFPLSIVGDTLAEGDETVWVRVSGLGGAQLNGGLGIATIVDDDAPAATAARTATAWSLRKRVTRGKKPDRAKGASAR